MYFIREDKCVSLLLCSLIQLKLENMHMFYGEMLGVKVQHWSSVVLAWRLRFITTPLMLTLWGRSIEICFFTAIIFVTNNGRGSSLSGVSRTINKRVIDSISCYSGALVTGRYVTIYIWYITIFNTALEKINLKGGNMYTFK